MYSHPTTVKALRAAVKQAKRIFMVPKFGNLTDTWVRVHKADAWEFVMSLPRNATPDTLEMFGTAFATFEDGTLYLG